MSYLASILLSPLLLLLAGIAAFTQIHRRPLAAKWLLGIMLGAFWLLSMPVVGDGLLTILDHEAEIAFKSEAADFRRAQAIVVLSGGSYPDSVEFPDGTVDAVSLERVRRAASVHRQTGLPLLTTGGSVKDNSLSLAMLLKLAAKEFGVSTKWVEEQSGNTAEKAQIARRILAPEGIDTIILVTHGWHMPRARRAFERAGFKVLPAATGLHSHGKLAAAKFLPSISALRNSGNFMREVIGLAWYEIIQAGADK